MKRDLATLASELTLKDLQQLLRKKEKDTVKVQKLQARREKLLAQIQGVEAEIENLAGSAPKAETKPRVKKTARRGRRKRKGGKTVRECAVEFLSSAKGDARLGEIVAHVVKERKGDAKPSPGDWAAVGTALRREESVERIGKGLYRLAGKKTGEPDTASKEATKKTKKKAGKKTSGAAAKKPKGPSKSK